jgi:hypothetical protein
MQHIWAPSPLSSTLVQLIHGLDTEVSGHLRVQAVYPRRKGLRYTLNRWLVGIHSRSGHFGKKTTRD